MNVRMDGGQLIPGRGFSSMDRSSTSGIHGLSLVFALLLIMGFVDKDAGSQELIWQRTEPGLPGGVAVDSQGNVVMLNVRGDHEVVKYDPNGEILWRATDGAGLNGSIAVDGHDNIVKVAERAFVTKISADGEVLWMTDMRDSCFMLWDVACDAEGNSFVTGEHYGMLLAKLNPDGEVVWTVEEWLSGGGGCAVDPWGDVIVCWLAQGEFWYDTNWWIVKYSSEGEKLWERVEGSPWEEEGGGMCVDNEGNIYVAGDWMVKYDRDGNLVWFDPQGLRGGSATCDGESSIYVGMNTSDESAQIARYDLDGNIVWMHPLAGGSDRKVNGVACSGVDCLAVLMRTSDFTQIITAKYWVGPGRADEENMVSPQLLRVFPNPVWGGAIITHLGKGTPGNALMIHDLSGRLVRRLETLSERTYWDCRDDEGLRVCPGTYLCRLVSGGNCPVQAYLVVTR